MNNFNDYHQKNLIRNGNSNANNVSDYERQCFPELYSPGGVVNFTPPDLGGNHYIESKGMLFDVITDRYIGKTYDNSSSVFDSLNNNIGQINRNGNVFCNYKSNW